MSRSEAGPIWIVTGERGAGKTTFCRDVVDRARGWGLDVAGVLSVPRFNPDEDEQAGIDLQDPRFGARRPLARRGSTEPSSIPVHVSRSPRTSTGGWAFNDDALVWGDLLLQAAVPCDLLIIDELGPLEFERESGWISGIRALDSQQYGSALAVVRPSFLDEAQRRWPDASIVRLNRDVQQRNRWIERILHAVIPRQERTHKDAARWNPRWASRLYDRLFDDIRRPRAFLADHLSDLPTAGLALDVAMGDGANTEPLLARGLDVVGVDISDVALRHATDRDPTLMPVLGDLESITLPAPSFDVILNFDYLQRDLWPQYVKALRPGGLLVVETVTEATLTEEPDLNPDHLLKSGELLAAFRDLETLDHREVWLGRTDEYPLAVESLLAQRPRDEV